VLALSVVMLRVTFVQPHQMEIIIYTSIGKNSVTYLSVGHNIDQ